MRNNRTASTRGRMVKNAANRFVPTKVNGVEQLPYRGIGKSLPTGLKAKPVVRSCAQYPEDGNKVVKSLTAALKKAGLTVDKMDVVESNEAFAAQALAVSRGLELDPKKTNPNGGAIALGHPIGCSGAFIATKALYELQRINGRYALVTMCIGGGQGIAAVFERI